MRRELFAALCLIPLLSACGGAIPASSGGVKSANTAPKTIRKPVTRPAMTAKVHMQPGLEGVIGATTADLTRQFGTPRLDVWEGDARKLQFSGTACVLDVYLYPMAQGREPQATYVDTRRASDGKDVDRASCVAALRGR
ncbi:MAG: hypothetical protein KDE55_23305 [Novosphingobium sp.]|nr:hypothetical protein [Novosphingobium sp.]